MKACYLSRLIWPAVQFYFCEGYQCGGSDDGDFGEDRRRIEDGTTATAYIPIASLRMLQNSADRELPVWILIAAMVYLRIQLPSNFGLGRIAEEGHTRYLRSSSCSSSASSLDKKVSSTIGEGHPVVALDPLQARQQLFFDEMSDAAPKRPIAARCALQQVREDENEDQKHQQRHRHWQKEEEEAEGSNNGSCDGLSDDAAEEEDR